jgi:predicted DNA-binding transcriptional regulator AlpA
MDDRKTPPTPQLVKEDAAADMLGTTVRTLQDWRLTGRGPRYAKLGRAVRYDLADIRSWLESRKYQSTADEAVRGGVHAAA